MREIWEYLNSLNPDTLLSEGRVYGGGLHKLEPKELGNVPVAELPSWTSYIPKADPSKQQDSLDLRN